MCCHRPQKDASAQKAVDELLLKQASLAADVDKLQGTAAAVAKRAEARRRGRRPAQPTPRGHTCSASELILALVSRSHDTPQELERDRKALTERDTALQEQRRELRAEQAALAAAQQALAAEREALGKEKEALERDRAEHAALADVREKETRELRRKAEGVKARAAFCFIL